MIDAFNEIVFMPAGWKLKHLGDDCGWARVRRPLVIHRMFPNNTPGHTSEIDRMLAALRESLPALQYGSSLDDVRTYTCEPIWRKRPEWHQFRCSGITACETRCGTTGNYGVETDSGVLWFCWNHEHQLGIPLPLRRWEFDMFSSAALDGTT